MSSLGVSYSLAAGIATIVLDDGRRNALSPALLAGLNSALDRAESDHATVIITGRDTVFSAGFDLGILRRGGVPALRMLHAGYSLTTRVMSHPHPVIAACNGHSLAMGLFLMLACDYAVGARGDFRIAANEVALGLPMPRVAAAMLRHRLTPSAFQRAVVLGRDFSTSEALDAGILDEAVDPAALMDLATRRATEFAALDASAHVVSKRRIRRSVTRYIRTRIPIDLLEAAWIGLRRRH